MFFGFWKKTLKNVKNVRSFTGHLITQPLITQLPEVSTGKSRSPTSNILLKSVDTRKYQNCVWLTPIRTHNIRELWCQNFCRHSTNFFLFCKIISIIEDKIFSTDFLRFFRSHFKKKRKKSCFFLNLKKTKNTYSRTLILATACKVSLKATGLGPLNQYHYWHYNVTNSKIHKHPVNLLCTLSANVPEWTIRHHSIATAAVKRLKSRITN